jgi:hypothetical protein
MSKEDNLKLLGDPSGQQNADYWCVVSVNFVSMFFITRRLTLSTWLDRNEWFEIVCKQDHTSFEWYCSCEEVCRVLKFHSQDEEEKAHRLRVIHPGSGTSLLPLELSSNFPGSQHVVLDVSDVALDEMRQVHDKYIAKSSGGNEQTKNPLEYELTDVLAPPLRFDDSSFDAWVDKGFVDAVFSKDSEAENKVQARKLFEEANRLLSDTGGVSIVVTLAEKHSLELLVQNWTEESNKWDTCLHVWELHPTSGDMLPFGIVMKKQSTVPKSINLSVVWHQIDSTIQSLTFSDKTEESVLQVLTKRIESAREAFVEQKSKPQETHQVLALIEIKPYDAEVDMQALGLKIVSETWHGEDPSNENGSKLLSPIWRSFSDEMDDKASFVRVVEIGYGISKAILQCIIDADDLDFLVGAITDWDGDAVFEDGVQSVDVDWENTMPVSSAAKMCLPKMD